MWARMEADNQRPEEKTQRWSPCEWHVAVGLILEQILVLISQHLPTPQGIFNFHVPQPADLNYPSPNLSTADTFLFPDRLWTMAPLTPYPKISVLSIRFGWLRSNKEKYSGFLYPVVFSKRYSITPCCFSFFPFWKLHHCLAELRKQNCVKTRIIPSINSYISTCFKTSCFRCHYSKRLFFPHQYLCQLCR